MGAWGPSRMLDLKTLIAITLFAQAVTGLLLLFSWAQNRGIRALGLWGVAFLMCALAMALVSLRGRIPNVVSIEAAGAIWMAAHGLSWTAARNFEGRPTPVVLTFLGAGIWLVACQLEPFATSPLARIMLGCGIIGSYLLLSAAEIWRGRDRELVSRWPAAALLAVHASFFLGRIPFADSLPRPGDLSAPDSWFPFGVFELLFYTMCMAVLLVNMAKERAESEQRQFALLDSLTGVANRRAFLELGARRLEDVNGRAAPAALLLFDLDCFKQINDQFGHPAGDAVLVRFCNAAARILPAGSVFGRMGGEEFACLIPDTAMAPALQTAERVRAAFAVASDRLDVPAATVSVGVATTGDAIDLAGLLAAADRALYRAKDRGRNRVEPARPTLSVVAGTAATPAPRLAPA